MFLIFVVFVSNKLIACIIIRNHNIFIVFASNISALFLFLDVAYFSGALLKYNNEHQMAMSIKESRNIGMMLVDTTKLKQVLIPSPLKCLEVYINLYYFII